MIRSFVRAARRADIEEIARLHITSWRASYRSFVPGDLLDAQDLDERRELFTRRFDDGMRFFVDDCAGALRGFVSLGPALDDDLDPRRVWTVHNLHISPELRGRALGASLLDAATNAAAEAGAETITLWVIEGNDGARRFYERHGMRCDGRVKIDRLLGVVDVTEVRYAKAIGGR
ncbi:MAG TPA: GNAT family N-acetyltransferase [Gemmatimonadaceae bacterium]|nr:GNAT family N-acetyltransferase [Gemmatimonadaceae bacterium]